MGKYEEALERAKAGKPLDEVFPELKESEDERIRKSLVDYFRNFKPQDMWDEMFSMGDVISYLEKQKEQAKEPDIRVRYKTRKDCYIEGFEDGVKSVKPAEWSEEDEQWLESIIKDYEDSLVKDKDHAAVIKIKIDFLKSCLCPQPHWKPSAEQMKCLEDCVNRAREIHNASTSGYDAYPTLNSLLHDIKSL